jgi:hypothetical protein
MSDLIAWLRERFAARRRPPGTARTRPFPVGRVLVSDRTHYGRRTCVWHEYTADGRGFIEYGYTYRLEDGR